MKNYMNWHKYSAVVMLVSAVVCMYSGHKMIAPKKKAETMENAKEQEAA